MRTGNLLGEIGSPHRTNHAVSLLMSCLFGNARASGQFREGVLLTYAVGESKYAILNEQWYFRN